MRPKADKPQKADLPKAAEANGGPDGRCMCDDFVKATEAAALEAGRMRGQGEGAVAHRAAVDAMRKTLDGMVISARVTVGFGDRYGADGLIGGREVGAGGRRCELAVDALEGTESLARGQTGAMSVLAVAAPGHILPVPRMYMQKIVVGLRAAGSVDMDLPVRENLEAIAKAYDRPVKDISVITLDRPRHEDLIEEIRATKARIKLIPDGDITASISAAVQGTGDHVYIGIGGAPEGIMTAAAMRSLGGEIQARFWPLSRSEVEACQKLGIDDIEAKLSTDDMVKGDVVFCATGVTRSDLLRGVFYFGHGARTQTLVMCTRCRNVRFVDNIQLFTQERREIRL